MAQETEAARSGDVLGKQEISFTSEPVASWMVGQALSGAQEMHSTTCSCSRSSALHSLEATTHTRTVWSLEQLAISVPSWLGRTMRTHSLWPVKVFTQQLMHRNKRTAKELLCCQSETTNHALIKYRDVSGGCVPSRHLPHFYGFVPRGRNDVISIGHDGYRRNIVVMSWKTEKTKTRSQ